jgi:hypothetical protein
METKWIVKNMTLKQRNRPIVGGAARQNQNRSMNACTWVSNCAWGIPKYLEAMKESRVGHLPLYLDNANRIFDERNETAQI